MPNCTVQPVHFEDFGGHHFERLVFAYLIRTDNWVSLEWYGQTGSDSGRDIWGVRERDGYPQGQKVCAQCANRKSLTYKKVQVDLAKIISHRPESDAFIVVAGGSVSATLRDQTKKLCEQNQVYTNEIWSDKEFEERLRAKDGSSLKRFIEGEEFPDTPVNLRNFAEAITPQSDNEVLALIGRLFDRPAFYTPFHQESSIPAFKKAVTDTIEALNTEYIVLEMEQKSVASQASTRSNRRRPGGIFARLNEIVSGNSAPSTTKASSLRRYPPLRLRC